MTKARINASKRSFLFKKLTVAVNYFMIVSMMFYTLIPVLHVSAEEMNGETAVVASEATVSAPSESSASSEVSAPAATETPAAETTTVEALVTETPIVEAPAVTEEPATTDETTAEEPAVTEPLIESLVIEEPIIIENLTDNSISTPAVIGVVAPVVPEVVENNAKVLVSEKVEPEKTYVAHQNSEVTVTFTKLPENPGSLSIEEITLTPDQVAELGALSNVAYDITSSMADGTFECDITLPIPAGETDVQIKNAEDVAGLSNAEIVPTEDVEVGSDAATVSSSHFTIFVTSKKIASKDTEVVFAGAPYYVAADKNTMFDTVTFTKSIASNIRFVFKQDGKIIKDGDVEWDDGYPKVDVKLSAGEYTLSAQYQKENGKWANLEGSAKVYSIDKPWAQFELPNKEINRFKSTENPIRIKVDDEFKQFEKVEVEIKSVKKKKTLSESESSVKKVIYVIDRKDCDREEAGDYLLCDIDQAGKWTPLTEGHYIAKALVHTKVDQSWVYSGQGYCDEDLKDADDSERSMRKEKCDESFNSVDFYIDNSEDEIIDTDEDGIADEVDNCVFVYNPDQADENDNGTGNACDEKPIIDTDDDGIADENDNCPTVVNSNQADADADGTGDACESSEILPMLQSFGGGSFIPGCRDVMYTCINNKVVLVNPAITQYCAMTAEQQKKLDSPCEAATGEQQVLGVQKYSIGTLLRAKTSPKIYVVIAENILKYIPNLKELFKYRGKAIISVDQSVINGYSKK